MSDLIIANKDDLTSVADALRTTGAASGQLSFPNGFIKAINDIPQSGEKGEPGENGLSILTTSRKTIMVQNEVEYEISLMDINTFDGLLKIGIGSLIYAPNANNTMYVVNGISDHIAYMSLLGSIKGETGQKGDAYVLTEADKNEIAETVKAEVPLVKVAEQPTFVNSDEEMTDTSKVYLMSDGYLYAYMKIEGCTSYTFTADDFIEGALTTTGDIYEEGTVANRIFTADLIDLNVGTVSIICPEPYQYITYYYTDNDVNTHIGKTAFKSGNVNDVLNDTTASGTVEGAKYCRISLRDKTDMTADISGRTDEFMANIIISQNRDEMTEVYKWKSMGLSYNQPADYENRIAALERAMEDIENGTY